MQVDRASEPLGRRQGDGDASAGSTDRPVGAIYRWYVTFILMLIFAFNLVDRQILTILAPYLKEDLHLSDAQFGLLFGTAFALFYGLFGIPLAKLSDGWSRVNTLSLGLFFWSVMTMVSGAATSFVQLGLARVGVGVGEASSSPAAISLLCDYFPKSMRGTVIALYTCGIYVGGGVSLMIGGVVVANWSGAFGLTGWQAAFMIVGAPGIVLALIVVLTLREPVRGAIDGYPQPGSPTPVADVLSEFAAMFPPWNVSTLRRAGAPAAAIRYNILMLLGAIIGSTLLIRLTDGLLAPGNRAPIFTIGSFTVTTNVVQWVSMGLAIYASASWMQSVRYRDPVAHRLVIGNRTFRALIWAAGLLGIFLFTPAAFNFVYAKRYLGFGPESGLVLGLIAAIAGTGGMIVGGIVGDFARARHPGGRLFVIMGMVLCFTMLMIWQYTTTSPQAFLITYGAGLFALTAWTPLISATVQDLAPPRLRGTAFSMTALFSNIIGLGLGPYYVGFLSDVSGDLRMALLSLLAVAPVIIILLFIASRTMRASEQATLDFLASGG